MVDVAQEVLRIDGFRGFFRGIGANFMKGIPSVGIGYVMYEKSLKAFSPHFDEH